MITESLECDICKGSFKMETAKSDILFDRANYFAIDKHHEDKPGALEIYQIEGTKIADVRKYKAHLCGYKCLGDYFALQIKDELILEEEKHKEKSLEALKKIGGENQNEEAVSKD